METGAPFPSELDANTVSHRSTVSHRYRFASALKWASIATTVLLCGVSCDGKIASIHGHIASALSHTEVVSDNGDVLIDSAVANPSLASVLPLDHLGGLEALVNELEERARGEFEETQHEADLHIVKAGEIPLLPPPSATSWLEDLPVEGHFDSIVSVPLDAREKRPLVIALHGDLDKPEWACATWRSATEGYPFILCPRGTHHVDYPKMDIWTFAWLQTTRKEIETAVKAARERYGAYISDGPVVLAGFSLGAVMAAHLMRESPAEFPVGILAEGSTLRDWSPILAKLYGDGGGKRVLFACSQKDCRNQTMTALDWFDQSGVTTSIAYAGNLGHVFGPELSEAIRAKWDWLTDGDARWRPANDPECRTVLSTSSTP
jgi:predicted esterase